MNESTTNIQNQLKATITVANEHSSTQIYHPHTFGYPSFGTLNHSTSCFLCMFFVWLKEVLWRLLHFSLQFFI